MTTAGESTLSSKSTEGGDPRFVDKRSFIITIAASSGSVLLVASMSLLLTAILLKKFRTVQRQQQKIGHCPEQGSNDSSEQSGKRRKDSEEESSEKWPLLKQEHICITGRDEEWLKRTQEAILTLCPDLAEVAKITTQLLTSKPYKVGLLQRMFGEALFLRATKVIFVALAEPRMILVTPVSEGESQLGGFYQMACEKKLDIFFLLVEEPVLNETKSAPEGIKELCENQPEFKKLLDEKRFARVQNKADILCNEEDTEALRKWLRKPSKSV